jgi:hypothetical protein
MNNLDYMFLHGVPTYVDKHLWHCLLLCILKVGQTHQGSEKGEVGVFLCIEIKDIFKAVMLKQEI